MEGSLRRKLLRMVRSLCASLPARELLSFLRLLCRLAGAGQHRRATDADIDDSMDAGLYDTAPPTSAASASLSGVVSSPSTTATTIVLGVSPSKNSSSTTAVLDDSTHAGLDDSAPPNSTASASLSGAGSSPSTNATNIVIGVSPTPSKNSSSTTAVLDAPGSSPSKNAVLDAPGSSPSKNSTKNASKDFISASPSIKTATASPAVRTRSYCRHCNPCLFLVQCKLCGWSDRVRFELVADHLNNCRQPRFQMQLQMDMAQEEQKARTAAARRRTKIRR